MPQVLVVEDDAVVRSVITTLLEDEGYAVHAVQHGAAALDYVTGRVRPDVILLDMWMPVMDGRTFAARYEALPGPHAPIIALTGALFASSTASPPASVAEVVTKPFDVDQLLDLVHRYSARSAERELVPA